MPYIQVAGTQHSLRVGETPVGTSAEAVLRVAGPETLGVLAILTVGRDGAVSIRRASGTVRVNGVQLGMEPSPLIHGDKIEVAGQELLFGDEKKSGGTQMLSGFDVPDIYRESGAVPARPTTATGGRLVSLVDGREYAVPEHGLTLGRDAGCDVVVPGNEVSRRHADIGVGERGYIITDASTNGVFVNGERIRGTQLLGRGDVVRIGNEEFRFYADIAVPAEMMESPAAAAAPPAPPAAPAAAPSPPPAAPAAASSAGSGAGSGAPPAAASPASPASASSPSSAAASAPPASAAAQPAARPPASAAPAPSAPASAPVKPSAPPASSVSASAAMKPSGSGAAAAGPASSSSTPGTPLKPSSSAPASPTSSSSTPASPTSQKPASASPLPASPTPQKSVSPSSPPASPTSQKAAPSAPQSPSPPAPPATAKPPAPAASAAAQAVDARPPLATLEVMSEGVMRGRRFDLRVPLANVGRGAHNDVVIPDDSVSDSHAKLQKRDGGWTVVDMGSTNGTYVAGRRIGAEQALEPECDLRFGGIKLRFRALAERVDEAKGTRAIAGVSVAEARRAASAAREPHPPAEPEGGRGVPVYVWVIALALLGLAVYFILQGQAR